MTVRRGLLWPLLLIVVGVVFLLANSGVIGRISLLAVLSLWPLILILIGIDIAIGRRWPLGALAADAVILAGGIALVATQPSLSTGLFFHSGEPGNASVSAARAPSGSTTNVRSATVRLSGGAGRYTLTGASQTELVKAQSDRDDLMIRTSYKNDQADVRVSQSDFQFGTSTSAQIDVTMADDVPTSVQVDVGAGEFVVDLSDVKVNDAKINAGAASLRIVAPTPSGDVPIGVSAGASSIVIEIPAGVEARVTTSGGLITTKFDNPRFDGSQTAGYASAKDRVTIKFSGGASSVVVR